MTRSRLSRLAAVATLTALTLAATAQTTSTVAASFGRAVGTWVLPMGASNGWIDGDLYAVTTTPTPSPTPAYHITGALTAYPVLCPSCIAGAIHGVLDDGVPGTPNLTVVGSYYGEFATGSGDFSALVYSPTAAAPVGKIIGRFSNPPLLPALGRFKAKWRIR